MQHEQKNHNIISKIYAQYSCSDLAINMSHRNDYINVFCPF